MCGIAGYVGEGSMGDLIRMAEAIEHRGPDDRGTVVREKVGLAHARLAIIDVSSAGHQPMFDTDASVGLVFNGEIYNYLELRAALLATGKYQFVSKTDTEVIIYAYKEYGQSCFEKIDGMFALALYDFTEKKLILARDRMGKKPLFWGQFGTNLIFGSEMTALLRHPACVKEIDLESLNSYIFHEYVPTPRSLLKNIFKLPPASYLVFDGETIDIKEYWKMDFTSQRIGTQPALTKLDQTLNDAVKRRLMADVPLGIFLSGGLDSSTVAYYAVKNNLQQVKTFSVGFEDKSFDESVYAQQVADFLKTDHHHRYITAKEMLECIPVVLSKLDEPMADQSIFATYILSKFAREQVTVALGGDGSDELLAGYPTFQAELIAPIYSAIPRFVRRYLIEPPVNRMPVKLSNFSLEFALKRFVRGFSVPSLYRHQAWMGNFHTKERQKLFTPTVLDYVKEQNEFAHVDRYAKNLGTKDRNSIFLHQYMRTYMMDGVLVKVDRASMMNGLEVRAPFLDTKVVEFINSLPYSFKLRGVTTKYILKKLMATKLPRAIVYRKKKGFGMPTASWLRSELRPWCDKVLSRERIEKQGLFNFDYIDGLKQRHYSGQENNHKKLWTLLTFMEWYERVFEKQ